jgi:hypothetical protein
MPLEEAPRSVFPAFRQFSTTALSCYKEKQQANRRPFGKHGSQFQSLPGNVCVQSTPNPVQAIQLGLSSTERVTRLGFEPRMSEPKSEVLPLHHRVRLCPVYYFPNCLTTAKDSCSNSIARSTSAIVTVSGTDNVTGAKFSIPVIPA